MNAQDKKREAVLFDISPESKNGTKIESAIGFTGGLTYEITGNKDELYAVSLNAGVWKTYIKESSTFAPWQQLANSPRYSSCIGLDPQFRNHIAVGERMDDLDPGNGSSLPFSGIWESFDGGNTFSNKHFLPYVKTTGEKVMLGQKVHEKYPVSDIIITNKSTVIAATPLGIARREMLGQWDKTLSENITALSCYENWLIARSASEIFLSNDDGKSWKWRESIPSTLLNAQFDLNNDREGKYSVSVLVSKKLENIFVYIPVSKINGTNIPSLLVYKFRTTEKESHWSYQDISMVGRGTGLGGRIFIKSFSLLDQTLSNDIGGKSQLIFCAGQDLLKAKSIQINGLPDWELLASSYGSDAAKKNFHSDIWDIHVDQLGHYLWAGTDGGVHYLRLAENNPNRFTTLSPSTSWYNLNEGLHTQHIHSSFVAEDFAKPVTVNQSLPLSSYFGYGTQDNDLWISDANRILRANPSIGDVNWVCGDKANSLFILGARHFQQFTLNKLNPNATTPNGSKTGNDWLVLNYCSEFNGIQSFQFIQTLSSEKPPEYLDAVMLTRLPLQYKDNSGGGNLINASGALSQTPGNLAILRNKLFAKYPDINASQGNGWTVEFNNLPVGTQGMWVSGGHVDPTYYIMCSQNGVTKFFKCKKSETSWSSITTLTARSLESSSTEFGPLFVNPYNPQHLFVSCTDGIYYSTDGGATSFLKDQELTDLISPRNSLTNKPNFPIHKPFAGGNRSNICWATQANNMCPLSSMSFDRNDPNRIVASSPFTGVFYKNGSSTWTDLSYLLPKPFTPVSSVNLSSDGIFITTEGRGFFLIKY